MIGRLVSVAATYIWVLAVCISVIALFACGHAIDEYASPSTGTGFPVLSRPILIRVTILEQRNEISRDCLLHDCRIGRGLFCAGVPRDAGGRGDGSVGFGGRCRQSHGYEHRA